MGISLMLRYEYACDACGKTFEVQQRMSDAALTDCECGAKGQVHRLVASAGIVFKGSGFYHTDYKGGSKSSHSDTSASSSGHSCGSPGCCKAAGAAASTNS